MTVVQWIIFGITIYEIVSASMDNEVELCLMQILTMYFNTSSVLVYDLTRIPNQHKKTLLPHSKIIDVNKIIHLSSQSNNRMIVVRDWANDPTKFIFESEAKRFQAENSIFIIDPEDASNYRTVRNIFRTAIDFEKWRRQAPSLVIINAKEGMDKSSMAKETLRAVWKWVKAINVVVMVVSTDRIFFYMWYPYKQPHCDVVNDTPAVDVWFNGTFLYNIVLYPQKITNDFQGCSLRIATINCLPYTYGFDTVDEFGFELDLIRAMSQHYNFSMIRKRLAKQGEFWSNQAPNGTLLGAIGQLNQQNIDMAFGCMMASAERYNLADTLPPFYHDSISWFIPTPSLRSHASNIYSTFPEDYWAIIVVTTIISTTIILAIIKIEQIVLMRPGPQNLAGASLRVFAMAISSPIAVPSKTILLRMFTFLFAIYSLHITTIYQASLFTLYRTNAYRGIYNTIEEAVDAGLFVWLRESIKHMYNQSDIHLWEKILQKGHFSYYQGDIDEPLSQIADNKSAIALYMKTTMLYYIDFYYRDESKAPKIMYIPEQFSAYPVSVFLSPGHPATRLLSDLMNNLVPSGLVQFWVGQIINEDSFKNRVAAPPKVSLKMEHVNGAFMFYSMLTCFSIAVFLLEFLWWLANGKTVSQPIKREELNMRREWIFVAVETIARAKMENRTKRLQQHR